MKINTERIVFFTLVSDNYYTPSGCPKFINSFKRYHPDVDLVVFRQDMIDKVFEEKKINFYMAKPTFAKLLTPYYDCVVNIDADHVVLGRLDEILKGDYDIAAPSNYNDYENMSIQNVTEKMFLQAGLVASTNKEFWDIWERENKNAMQYPAQENTVMNLIVYNDPVVSKMKLKVLDGEKDYYGCKSLNREPEFYIKDGQVMCRDEQVFLYHAAKGGNNMPKLVYGNMGFKPDVIKFMDFVSSYGKSVRYGSL